MNFLLKLVVFSWYFWGKALYNGLKTSPDLDITVCSSHTTEYLTIESIFQLFHDSFKLLIMTDGCGISNLGMTRFSIPSQYVFRKYSLRLDRSFCLFLRSVKEVAAFHTITANKTFQKEHDEWKKRNFLLKLAMQTSTAI